MIPFSIDPPSLADGLSAWNASLALMPAAGWTRMYPHRRPGEQAAGGAADSEGAGRHGESDRQAEEPLSGRSLLVATFSTT